MTFQLYLSMMVVVRESKEIKGQKKCYIYIMKRAKNTKSGHFIWLMTTLYQFLKKENGELGHCGLNINYDICSELM